MPRVPERRHAWRREQIRFSKSIPIFESISRSFSMKINMKINPTISLAVAAVSLSLLYTPIVHAQIAPNADTSAPASSANIAAGESEAAQMVPALAELDSSVSADMESGRRFQAILGNSVRLKDGTELPDGTVLIGFVAY